MSIKYGIAAFGESTFLGFTQNVDDHTVPNIVAGLPRDLTVKVENKAIASTTIDAQFQPIPGPLVPARIAENRSPIAIVNFGINDAWQGTDVTAFRTKLAAVVDSIRRAGKRVFLQTPNAIAATHYADGTALKNGISPVERLSEMAAAVNYVAGLYGLDCDGNGPRDIPLSDGIFHPTDAGYATAGTSLRNVVVSVGALADATYRVQAALIYIATLCRAPDVVGLNYWVTELAAGRLSFDNGSLAAAFLATPLVQTIYPDSASNSQFVTAIYVNVLGRQPEQDGLTYWTTRLANGESRAMVITEIVDTTYSYAENGGKLSYGLASQRLLLNRLSVGLAYGWIFAKTAYDTYPSGLFATVTDDPATVHPVTNTF